VLLFCLCAFAFHLFIFFLIAYSCYGENQTWSISSKIGHIPYKGHTYGDGTKEIHLPDFFSIKDESPNLQVDFVEKILKPSWRYSMLCKDLSEDFSFNGLIYTVFLSFPSSYWLMQTILCVFPNLVHWIAVAIGFILCIGFFALTYFVYSRVSDMPRSSFYKRRFPHSKKDLLDCYADLPEQEKELYALGDTQYYNGYTLGFDRFAMIMHLKHLEEIKNNFYTRRTMKKVLGVVAFALLCFTCAMMQK
jgi:hypothetical protein